MAFSCSVRADGGGISSKCEAPIRQPSSAVPISVAFPRPERMPPDVSVLPLSLAAAVVLPAAGPESLYKIYKEHPDRW
jgi:hypothetical protein